MLEPHPNLPYLATSGLDNEVKIWFPTSEDEVDFKTIEKVNFDEKFELFGISQTFPSL